MEIAFIGTSLGNSFFASVALEQGASVTFFEASHLGGAWGQAPLNGVDVPRFNNIVFPYDPTQEERLEVVFEWLIGRGARVELVQNNFDVSTSFKPAKIAAGNFAAPIISVVESPNSVLKYQPVRTIDVYESRAVVNDRDFDFVVLPLNASVESLRFISKDGGLVQERLEWEFSVSEHLRAVYQFPIEGQVFAENKDDVFDRFGVIPGEVNLFIGRVARQWKGAPPEVLIARSSVTNSFAQKQIAFDFLNYEQSRMDQTQFERLIAQAIGSRLLVINSSDAISSIQSAEASLSRIFGGTILC